MVDSPHLQDIESSFQTPTEDLLDNPEIKNKPSSSFLWVIGKIISVAACIFIALNGMGGGDLLVGLVNFLTSSILVVPMNELLPSSFLLPLKLFLISLGNLTVHTNLILPNYTALAASPLLSITTPIFMNVLLIQST
jgi:hypothetical protein